MNLNTEHVTEALEQSKKVINQIMRKYNLDYYDKIGEQREREVKDWFNKSIKEQNSYIKKEEMKGYKYFQNVLYYKEVIIYYWRIYNYFENEIELININLNVKSYQQLIKEIESKKTILSFEYQRRSPEYLKLESYEYRHPEIIKIQDDIKISEAKNIAIELFEIESKVKLLQYIIDYLLSPERSGPKKRIKL
jgi:hypothetical protein